MKKILLFSLMMVAIAGSAQLTVVKEITASGLVPQEADQFLWQNNKWNGKRYFPVASTPSVKLAVTDGTDAGTKIITDLGFTGISSATVKKIIPAKDFFYFHVNILVSFSPYTSRDELWKSDGTVAGTVLVKRFEDRGATSIPIEIGTDPYSYQNNTVNGNEMYFTGYSSANGNEMWKTDGTAAGTYMVKDMYTGTAANVVGAKGFTRLNNEVFFYANNYKLWKTDGTAAGTVLLDVPGLTMVDAGVMNSFKGKIYFMGFSEGNGVELWTSDGTVAGTKMFKNLSPNTVNQYSLTGFNLQKTSQYLIFSTTNTDNMKHTLFRTDGTEAGTVQLSPDDAIDPGSSNVLFSMNEENFYCTNFTRKTIFRTDYQPGTGRLVSTGQYTPNGIYNYLGTAWYAGATSNWSGNNDYAEPHRTDGIQAVKTYDLNPTVFGTNNSGSNPFGWFEADGFLHFFANSGTGLKLYRFKGDYTFNRTVNNNWSTPANWNAGITPLTTEDATVPSGNTVIVDTGAAARNLSLSSPLNITSGNLTIGGTVDLNAKITLNGNNLNLKGNSSQITNGNSTNYIVTNGTGSVNVENLNAERGTVNIPIGTATNYNPVSIANTGTSDTFSARVSEGISNTTNGAVNTTWEISEAIAGGSNATISLGWNASQQNGAFNPNNATVGHYVNGAWTAENSGAVSGSNPYNITGTGITSFSPFAVMNLGALATADPLKKNISVYPNPFREALTVTAEDKATVHLYDMSGKMVGSHALVKGTNVLNPAALKPGVYIYQIKNTNDEILSSGKIIKK